MPIVLCINELIHSLAHTISLGGVDSSTMMPKRLFRARITYSGLTLKLA